MDSLRNIEVKTNNLASSQSLFSQQRWYHAAVSINDKIILVGGRDSSSKRSGEIIGEGKMTQITFTPLVMIHSILIDCRWVTAESPKQWRRNMCGRVQDRLCHNWKLAPWKGGQVFKSNHFNHHHPLSVRGMTLKANTWIPFPTWLHPEVSTVAQAFS